MSLTNPNFDIKEFAIQGKLVKLSATLSELERMKFFSDKQFIEHIKTDLALKLADFIVTNKLIEFVYNQNPYDFSTRVDCRCYIAPNDQVKILRIYEK
jgi:hypothetical protein